MGKPPVVPSEHTRERFPTVTEASLASLDTIDRCLDFILREGATRGITKYWLVGVLWF